MEGLALYLFGVLILLAGLALSIGLHEIGHLVPAKLFNVKVNKYMIGFGPTLWSKNRGETEYGVKLIPLGGYISMEGMFPTPENRAEKRVFYRLSTLKKITVMLGGPIMNLLLAFVFTAVVVSGFGVAAATTSIASVSQCLAIPAGSSATECATDTPEAPAAQAGLLPGDTILAIDANQIADWSEVSQIISESPGKALSFEILRGGSTTNITITPVYGERQTISSSGDTVVETVGMIGITPATETVREPLTAVPGYVFDNVQAVANIILHMPQRLVAVAQAAFGDAERDLNSPVSVVGVGRLAGEIVSHDEAPLVAKVQTMMGLLGSLNVALFVFNLVPLLPLDGGHVLGALYEGTKRRLWRLFGKEDPGPVDTTKMMPVTLVVAAVLIVMTILLVYADIVKPINLFK